jgi:hypothetical protein
MEKQTVMRSPVGPLAWEFQIGVSEASYPDYRYFSIPSPSLPEIRRMPSLPVPRNSQDCRLVQNGVFPRTLGGRTIF